MKNCARRQGLQRRQLRACRWQESEDTRAADCEVSWLEKWKNTHVVECSDGGVVSRGGKFFSFDTTCSKLSFKCACVCTSQANLGVMCTPGECQQ